MTKPDLFIGGKRLEIAKRIGKGGEGDVFLLSGEDKKAVKIYRLHSPDREAKVKTMVACQLWRNFELVAFPEQIVAARSGRFAGFSMRLVEGFREIHDLYGPKSRKEHYPKADFRRLVRAAANAARAVGEVHNSSCVIGDLNESGLLVSSEMKVALIDADSFQLTLDGRVYPCLVGKAEFTAPELHNQSLAGVTRTRAHDHFGLAVAIFQLLFMGRHPYAGRQKGSDLSLDEMIARNLFAYSKRRQTGAAPPGVLPSLDDFPAEIGDAFERAFGLDPSKRPSAKEWVALLQNLERRLTRCANDQAHYYPSAAKACPWCRMESATGVLLFVSTISARATATLGIRNFDVERAWAAIKSVIVPDPNSVTPKLPVQKYEPSQEARSAKGSGLIYKLFGWGVGIAAIAAWMAMPKAALLWLGALIFALFQFGRSSIDHPEWRKRYSAIDARWNEALGDWRNMIGVRAAAKLRADLETAVSEYRGLDAAKAKAVTRLKQERHARQLGEYLDRFLIRRASISGIGHAKTVTLASFGIESAADIKRNAILRIPGFGSATTDKLMAWRSQHERRFVYNSAPNQSDVTTQARLDVEFANRAASLARTISGGQVELLQSAEGLRRRLNMEDARLTQIASERAQLEADLSFLGVSKPHWPVASAVISRTTYTQPALGRPTGGSGILCPNCGSRMVRRTAKRGYRRGSQFWGCSRYPACRGTRP